MQFNKIKRSFFLATLAAFTLSKGAQAAQFAFDSTTKAITINGGAPSSDSTTAINTFVDSIDPTAAFPAASITFNRVPHKLGANASDDEKSEWTALQSFYKATQNFVEAQINATSPKAFLDTITIKTAGSNTEDINTLLPWLQPALTFGVGRYSPCSGENKNTSFIMDSGDTGQDGYFNGAFDKILQSAGPKTELTFSNFFFSQLAPTNPNLNAGIQMHAYYPSSRAKSLTFEDCGGALYSKPDLTERVTKEYNASDALTLYHTTDSEKLVPLNKDNEKIQYLLPSLAKWDVPAITIRCSNYTMPLGTGVAWNPILTKPLGLDAGSWTKTLYDSSAAANTFLSLDGVAGVPTANEKRYIEISKKAVQQDDPGATPTKKFPYQFAITVPTIALLPAETSPEFLQSRFLNDPFKEETITALLQNNVSVPAIKGVHLLKNAEDVIPAFHALYASGKTDTKLFLTKEEGRYDGQTGELSIPLNWFAQHKDALDQLMPRSFMKMVKDGIKSSTVLSGLNLNAAEKVPFISWIHEKVGPEYIKLHEAVHPSTEKVLLKDGVFNVSISCEEIYDQVKDLVEKGSTPTRISSFLEKVGKDVKMERTALDHALKSTKISVSKDIFRQ